MRVLFATGNVHKVEEANAVAAQYNVVFEQIQQPYPEIRADDVADVAHAGAEYVFRHVGNPVVVEDSGLYIKHLAGFPGAYSKFVYEKVGLAGILMLLEGVTDRRARFVSAVGYHDGTGVAVFEGVVEGTIAPELRGSGGFGYDPIFIPGGYSDTFAEDPQTKNAVSHRRKAVEAFCRKQPPI